MRHHQEFQFLHISYRTHAAMVDLYRTFHLDQTHQFSFQWYLLRHAHVPTSGLAYTDTIQHNTTQQYNMSSYLYPKFDAVFIYLSIYLSIYSSIHLSSDMHVFAVITHTFSATSRSRVPGNIATLENPHSGSTSPTWRTIQTQVNHNSLT